MIRFIMDLFGLSIQTDFCEGWCGGTLALTEISRVIEEMPTCLTSMKNIYIFYKVSLSTQGCTLPSLPSVTVSYYFDYFHHPR